jgi:hypothetical protein
MTRRWRPVLAGDARVQDLAPFSGGILVAGARRGGGATATAAAASGAGRARCRTVRSRPRRE